MHANINTVYHIRILDIQNTRLINTAVLWLKSTLIIPGEEKEARGETAKALCLWEHHHVFVDALIKDMWNKIILPGSRPGLVAQASFITLPKCWLYRRRNYPYDQWWRVYLVVRESVAYFSIWLREKTQRMIETVRREKLAGIENPDFRELAEGKRGRGMGNISKEILEARSTIWVRPVIACTIINTRNIQRSQLRNLRVCKINYPSPTCSYHSLRF